MGWWLLGTCLCSASLPSAHLQVLPCCSSSTDDRDNERRLFSALPPKEDIARAMALPLTDRKSQPGLGAGLWHALPSTFKLQSFTSPYTMNLCRAMCSHTGQKVETLNFMGFLIFVSCFALDFTGWMQSLVLVRAASWAPCTPRLV